MVTLTITGPGFGEQATCLSHPCGCDEPLMHERPLKVRRISWMEIRSTMARIVRRSARSRNCSRFVFFAKGVSRTYP